MNAKAATLVVDIGNTSTSLAVAKGLKLSSIQRTPSATPALKLSSVPERAVIASVKPGVNKRWEKFLKQKGVSVHLQDRVTVTGAALPAARNAGLMASALEVNGRTVTLRDAQGLPLWREPARAD